jgi:hypothetical protein
MSVLKRTRSTLDVFEACFLQVSRHIRERPRDEFEHILVTAAEWWCNQRLRKGRRIVLE